MAIWNRKTILNTAINDWQSRGMIDAQTAETLLSDTDTHSSSFSFQNILILLAVICLGFAAVTFVAANWDEMARLTRVGIVVGAMWLLWGSSALFHMRGHNWFAQVFTLGACAMFGAGIMLISQIYHIQGSAKDATWLWAMGTLLGATLTRSTPALALTIALLTVWSWLEPSMFSWRHAQIQYTFPLYMIVCGALAFWMHSRFCAHLIVLATAVWAVPSGLALLDDGNTVFPASVIAATFVLITSMLYSDRTHNWLRGFERAVVFYGIGTLGIMCFGWSIQTSDGDLGWASISVFRSVGFIGLAAIAANAGLAIVAFKQKHLNLYDIIVATLFTVATFICMVFASGTDLYFMIFLLAASVWIIRMGWRIEYRPIAVLGFIAFGLMMLWVYFETIGTLLGTSVFYAVAGVLMLAGVFIVPRLTRTHRTGVAK